MLVIGGELLQAGEGFPDARKAVVLVLDDETVLVIQPKRSLRKHPHSSISSKTESFRNVLLHADIKFISTRGNHLNANGEEEFPVGLGALPQEEGAAFRSPLFQLVDCKLRPDHQNIEGKILVRYEWKAALHQKDFFVFLVISAANANCWCTIWSQI